MIRARTLAAVVAMTVTAIASVPARAGGMMLPMQGIRDLSRAGAFVAGVDDASALFINPAGLGLLAGDEHRAVVFDVAYVRQKVSYVGLDSSGRPLAKVGNSADGQTLPTLAASIGLGDKLVIAGGIAEPSVGLANYPDTGPQRYAGTATTGSSFVRVALGAAYVVSPRLRVGATVQDLVSTVVLRVALSECPPGTACAPTEASNAQYDALTQIQQHDYFAPSGSLGVQYDAADNARLGLSVQAPTRISAEGTLQTRAPAASMFDGATVVGTQGTIGFTLPPTVRAGCELKLDGHVRVEAAIDIEFWSVQSDIRIVPDGVKLVTAGNAATYALSTIKIPRDYQTSIAASLGGEARYGKLGLAAGYAYETSAAPAANVSVLTVDAAKHILGLGVSYELDDWSIGAGGGLALLDDVNVPLASATVPQLDAIRSLPPAYVNAGAYSSFYVVAGARATHAF